MRELAGIGENLHGSVAVIRETAIESHQREAARSGERGEIRIGPEIRSGPCARQFTPCLLETFRLANKADILILVFQKSIDSSPRRLYGLNGTSRPIAAGFVRRRRTPICVTRLNTSQSFGGLLAPRLGQEARSNAARRPVQARRLRQGRRSSKSKPERSRTFLCFKWMKGSDVPSPASVEQGVESPARSRRLRDSSYSFHAPRRSLSRGGREVQGIDRLSRIVERIFYSWVKHKSINVTSGHN